MADDVDIYKPGKQIKRTDEPNIDLKNPAVLKKYQEVIAQESNRHQIKTYVGRNRYPSVRIQKQTVKTTHPAIEDKETPSSLKMTIVIAVLLVIIIALVVFVVLK